MTVRSHRDLVFKRARCTTCWEVGYRWRWEWCGRRRVWYLGDRDAPPDNRRVSLTHRWTRRTADSLRLSHTNHLTTQHWKHELRPSPWSLTFSASKAGRPKCLHQFFWPGSSSGLKIIWSSVLELCRRVSRAWPFQSLAIWKSDPESPSKVERFFSLLGLIIKHRVSVKSGNYFCSNSTDRQTHKLTNNYYRLHNAPNFVGVGNRNKYH